MQNRIQKHVVGDERMQQRIMLDYDLLLDQESIQHENEPLQINVFTSQYCSFCSDALDVVYSAVDRLSSIRKSIHVVETTIDDKPSLVEDLNILALPMIQVGHLRIIGLPRAEDVEKLVNQTILMGL